MPETARRLTATQLNRATLARQVLLNREPLAVADAVHRVVALQAQEPASPYVALWNRITGFDAADLDAAFAHGSVVKATLMRATVHAVDARDYPTFQTAMRPFLSASSGTDPRFTSMGLSVADTEALVPELLAFADRPRTRIEIEGMLAARFGEPWPGLWWALRRFAPLVHAPTGGPWSFGPRAKYASGEGRVRSETPHAALPAFVQRYLQGFGPASIADVAKFASIARVRVREAVRVLGDRLIQLEGPDGDVLFDVRGGLLPSEDAIAPARLLPMWDSVLLAYADRSRIIPPEYRRSVIRANGDVLPTLLVDGHVAGVWRPLDGRIEVTAFHPLSDLAWADIGDEVASLLAFLEPRDPGAYGRYRRWWGALPGAEVRLLPD